MSSFVYFKIYHRFFLLLIAANPPPPINDTNINPLKHYNAIYLSIIALFAEYFCVYNFEEAPNKLSYMQILPTFGRRNF